MRYDRVHEKGPDHGREWEHGVNLSEPFGQVEAAPRTEWRCQCSAWRASRRGCRARGRHAVSYAVASHVEVSSAPRPMSRSAAKSMLVGHSRCRGHWKRADPRGTWVREWGEVGMRRGRQGGAVIYRCRVSSTWPVGCGHRVLEQPMRASPCDTNELTQLEGRSDARDRQGVIAHYWVSLCRSTGLRSVYVYAQVRHCASL